MKLRTVTSKQFRLFLVPSNDELENFCIQWVMRDYADVADEMNEVYAEIGSAAYNDPYYEYLGKLEKAFARRIGQVIR